MSCLADESASRLFLVPPEDGWSPSATPRPREQGWVDIAFGRIAPKGSKRVLTMTTLQAEDRSGVIFKPESWLRAARKSLKPCVTFGVKGINIVHGGTSDYQRIGYSLGALELREEGAVWKQYPDDNSVFEPLQHRTRVR